MYSRTLLAVNFPGLWAPARMTGREDMRLTVSRQKQLVSPSRLV